jgi:hypothetical protein
MFGSSNMPAKSQRQPDGHRPAPVRSLGHDIGILTEHSTASDGKPRGPGITAAERRLALFKVVERDVRRCENRNSKNSAVA